MLASDIDFGKTLECSYKDVVLGRRTCRSLDPSYVVPREEILQIIQEALSFTPSGGNCQPYKFLIVDTDEGKKKIDAMMRGVDVGRIRACSFAIIPMFDREYINNYDRLMELNIQAAPDKYTPDHVKELRVVVENAISEMMEEESGLTFETMLAYQLGLACMSIMIVLRAHGLDSGEVTDWNPALLEDEFGIDLERYRPIGTIAVGKNIGPAYDCYRFPADELTDFIG